MQDEHGNLLVSLSEGHKVVDKADGEQTEMRHLSNTVSEPGSEWPYRPRLNFKKPLPEQNIEEKLHSDKPISEVLAEVEQSVNKITLGLLSHYPYVIKDDTRPAWSTTRQQSGKESEGCNVKRDLDKVLGMGEFSGSLWNPVMNKITTKARPVFRIIMLMLHAYRAIYNVITWRDPYLAFWLSVGCIVFCILILLIPWRPIIFVIGVMVLGPQNWAFRVFKEYVWQNERPNRFIRVLRELLRPDDVEHGTEDWKDSKQLSVVAQPIFQRHAPVNKQIDDRTHKPIAAQHVLVPYSPLICQRFSDWPPDPKYALVTAEKKSPSVMVPSHGQAYVAKEQIKPQPKQPVRLPTTAEVAPLLASSASSTLSSTSHIPRKGRQSFTGKSEKDSSDNAGISEISFHSSTSQTKAKGNNTNGKSGLGAFLTNTFSLTKQASSNESEISSSTPPIQIMNVTGQKLEKDSETKSVNGDDFDQLQETPDESSLIEQLMQVKLELAAALTQNGHCREELKNVKEERDQLRDWHENFTAESLSKKDLNHPSETQQTHKTERKKANDERREIWRMSARRDTRDET